MACKLSTNCNLIFGILSCTLPEDTIDVDLKIHTLWWYILTKRTGVHKSLSAALGELRSSPSCHHRRRWQNSWGTDKSSFQPRPKVAARKSNLVSLTRWNRVKLLQPRKINIGPLPEATQWNMLATLKAKEVAGATTSLAPHTDQPVSEHTIHTVSYFPCTSKHWTY